MLSIRLSRTGKKNQPFYRLIVLDKRKDPWGDFIEALGSYDPRKKTAQLKAERIKYWLGVGAEPTTTAWNLLVRNGVIDAPKRSLPSKKRAGVITPEASKPATA